MNYDILLAKFYANGTLQWTKALGGTKDDHGYSVIETSNGSLVVAGYTYSFGAGSSDMFVAKLYTNGTLQITSRINTTTITSSLSISTSALDISGANSLLQQNVTCLPTIAPTSSPT